MRELYERYKRCIIQITIRTQMGTQPVGTGFHIGDGYIVTARHIVEDHTIELVGGDYSSRNVTIKRVL